MYFMDFHDMLKKQYGVVSMDKKRYHAEQHIQAEAAEARPAGEGDLILIDAHAHSEAGHRLEEAMSKR